MRLVFYGGGDGQANIDLDSSLIELTKKKRPRITYIPSCSYDGEEYFREFVEQYDKFNITKFIYFPIDLHYDEIMLKEAFKSDIIHLSGGNTYYFLKHLRKKGLIGLLRQYVRDGGVLTGLSAGAIIMTPTIQTAGIPDFDKDENDENMTNFKALRLVNFEMFPHYKNSHRYDNELKRYSENRSTPIYACPDGTGIVVNNNTISFLGKVFCFCQGKKVAVR